MNPVTGKELLNKDITLIKMTYVPQYHTFDVECIMPNKVIPEIKRLNYRNFPNHKPFKFLNGSFQINQEVRVWLKDLKELQREGWEKLTAKSQTLKNKDAPYTIGKTKAQLLGKQSIKGFIGVSEKMRPYVVIKHGDQFWRFTEAEIRFILPATTIQTTGKAVVTQSRDGYQMQYDPSYGISGGIINLDARYVPDLINLLRKAEII